MILEYARIREDAHPPERANPSDAGLDLFFNPEPSGLLPHPEKDAIVIEPGESKVIPTGYRFGVPHGYMLEIKNRSSVAAKRSLIVGACVVDSGYDGEVFVNLHNIGREAHTIQPRDKIAQAVMVPIETPEVEEIGEDNVYGTETDRGDGGFGSTGIFQ